MTKYQTRPGAHRLGFMIPLVLFVLFFVACCGVLASVFIRSAQVSTDALRLNTAVQLCRNQAEALRAEASGEDFPRVIGTQTLYYDSDCCSVSEAEADYVLTLTEAPGDAPAGVLRSFTLTAFTMEQEPLYSLDVAVYLPDGR